MPGTVLGLLDTWSHFRSQQFCQRLKHSHFIQEETEEKGGRKKKRKKRRKGRKGFAWAPAKALGPVRTFMCHHISSLRLEGGNLTC